MPQTFVTIRGIDPLLFRDGRPFTTDAGGLTAQSLPLPSPYTVAGFLRGQIGTAGGWEWNHAQRRNAHGIPVHAPLLLVNEKAVLPAPEDALLNAEGVPSPLLPAEENRGCDLPDGLRPLLKEGVLPTEIVEEDSDKEDNGKPATGYHFWTAEAMLGWLEGVVPTQLDKIGGLPFEERIGIEIDKSGKAVDGQLYATQLRAFGEKIGCTRQKYALVARTKLSDSAAIAPAGTLGGERRLTVVEKADDTDAIWPRCSPLLKEKLASATRVRMVLATPAIFAHGWKPGWIAASGSGQVHLPAGLSKVKLRLVAAAVGRREPVSGWRLRESEPGQGDNGPRPVRWMVPAGSVYFFEIEPGNDSRALLDAWMQPVSDNEQDRCDGFGLALWGTW